MNLDEQLDSFVKQVGKTIPNDAQKHEMTKAGADVLVDRLRTATREKHYQKNRNTSKVKHLADSVDAESFDETDQKVGYETAAVSGINHARIARLLNDGWKGHPGDHFQSIALKQAEPDVFKAEQAEYQKITGGDD
ncbi:MAG: hypothetical protein ACTIAG_04595 [Lactobacillus sp.]